MTEQEFLIDKDNADDWVSIIGKPLVDAIKNSSETPNDDLFVVQSIDKIKKIITVVPYKNE